MAPISIGLFRLFGGRYLNLNGVGVVELCRVYRNYSKTAVTAVRVAHLDSSRRLRSGRAWTHRIGGSFGYSQAGARIAWVSLLHLLFCRLLTS